MSGGSSQFSAVVAVVLLCAGAATTLACGGDPGARVESPKLGPGEEGLTPEANGSGWGTYRSKRFGITLRLPGTGEWRVDDRSRRELWALHGPSRARLAAERWAESDNQNRATCEAKARARGLAPSPDASVLDDNAAVRPTGEDVRVWVAIEPGNKAEAPLRGHATLVGAHFKKCWAVHYVTEIASAAEEAALSERLARIRQGTLDRITVEAPLEGPRQLAPSTAPPASPSPSSGPANAPVNAKPGGAAP